MEKTKKQGLGQNNIQSKIFYALLVLLPSLQFLFFYVFVNINSFSLAFKVFPTGILKDYVWSFENFAQWFTKEAMNTEMTAAIGISLKIYLISICTGVPLGLFFSYYMFKRMPGSKLFRVLLFMPSILSAAVISTMYKMVTERVLGGTGGVIEQLFGSPYHFWDKENRFTSLMCFNIFVSFGTSVLMYTNRMDAIDPEMIESANLDGATGIKEFIYISFPMIWNTFSTFMVVSLTGIFTNQFNLFSFYQSWAPEEMQTLGYYLYKETQLNTVSNAKISFSHLSSLGIIITCFTLPLAIITRKIMAKLGPSVD